MNMDKQLQASTSPKVPCTIYYSIDFILHVLWPYQNIIWILLQSYFNNVFITLIIIRTNLTQQTCTSLVTYSLTPWSRVLLEKLSGSQLVKKFPTFYGTQRFITHVLVHLYKLTFQLLLSFNIVVHSFFLWI
jgi:hypothetical protein